MVTGRARPDSDVDAVVLLDAGVFPHLPLKYRADLIADVGQALETFKVGVVLLNNSPPALAFNVITQGQLIFERSKSARVALQVRNLNESEGPIHFLMANTTVTVEAVYDRPHFLDSTKDGSS